MENPPEEKYEGRTESGATQSETRLMVNSALARLPEAQRRVLEMAYFDGLTQSEIASRRGEPLGTVKTRLRLALHKVRDELTEVAS